MSWMELDIVELRKQFIQEFIAKNYPSFQDLCKAYGISRKTGYKWRNRFMSGGFDNLSDHSRAPLTTPHQTSDEVCQLIIDMKLKHNKWGPKKVLDRLKRMHPSLDLPADSTAGEILKRAGLVKKRRKRNYYAADEQAFETCTENNQVWGVDYKGQFKLGNGQMCYPLTITDMHSRYLIRCQSLKSTCYKDAKNQMEQAFREYGLPHTIRSDNGTPFSSLAAGGISRLSKWWIKLGIHPQRIKPGHPQQNGRHERMHRTLKEATIKPAAHNEKVQQERFDAFVHEYNYERSHEGLGRKCPADIYKPSLKTYPDVLPDIVYDEGKETRKVKRGGEIKWRNHHIYISQVLSNERICLEEIDDDIFAVFYGFYKLGEINGKDKQLKRATKWHHIY